MQVPDGWNADLLRVDARLKPRKVRLGKYHGDHLARLIVDCPFCGTMVHTLNGLQWCNGCYVEWTRQGQVVTFDPAKRTERYAWAKAVAKSGGMQIGTAKEKI